MTVSRGGAEAPRLIYIFLGLTLFAALVRAQTFDNPVVGFDEQFYLLVGDRMWHGAVPFVDIFDRKPIGLFLIFAAARGLGGDGFLQYKLVALGFVVATALLIYRAGRSVSTPLAGIVAACLYILWLNFMEGEGGQAEVFLNLPMMAAALIVWRVAVRRQAIVALGSMAMLFVGIALQIKYTVVFEGIFFGLTLIWAQFYARGKMLALVAPTLLWVACALLPTILAALVYWRIGSLNAFVFANFTSIFGKAAAPQMLGLLIILGVLLPLFTGAIPSLRARNTELYFIRYWFVSALVGIVAFRTFGAPHYGIPVLLPLTVLVAPGFAAVPWPRRFALAGVGLAFLLGQLVLWHVAYTKGGRAAANAVTAAALPRHGCIYVYDGYPALYMLTHACLPTRWAFPGHLNTADEAHEKALGVDPVTEVTRILASRPDVIVDDEPVFEGGNPATRARVQDALAHDYRLVLRLQTGTARYRLVYRLK